MKVQELLSSKEKWTQEALARDKDGKSVPYNSPDAVKWCLIGAIDRCYSLSEINELVRKFENKKIGLSLFNDSHTYEEVMELVRRLDL